jgi:hypothetical protein
LLGSEVLLSTAVVSKVIWELTSVLYKHVTLSTNTHSRHAQLVPGEHLETSRLLPWLLPLSRGAVAGALERFPWFSLPLWSFNQFRV